MENEKLASVIATPKQGSGLKCIGNNGVMEKEILKMEYYVPKSANNSYLCKIIIVKNAK